MVAKEPLLRLGIVVAMAAGGIVLLVLLSLMMYACCRSHRARAIAQESRIPRIRVEGVDGPMSNIPAAYRPAVAYRHDDREVNPMQLQPPSILRHNSREAIRTSQQSDEGRDRTPPPPYEDVVCLPLPPKPPETHDYST